MNEILSHNNSCVKFKYNYVYLTGDNAKVSKDSREYGEIPYGLIESRVLFKVISILIIIFCLLFNKKSYI
jgi:hypothetical protein